MLKKIKLFISCSEDIAIAKQDYFLAYTQLICWRFWQKCQKYASSRQTKVTVLWFVNAQIESIKGKKQIRHTLLL
jgi:hypothetical protein